MGAIKVGGNCKVDYEAEILIIRLRIHASDSSSGRTISLGKTKLEKLLQTLESELEIKPDCFVLERENVEKRYNQDSYTYTKSLSIKIDFNLMTAERITDVFSTFEDLDYSFEYQLRNVKLKEESVLKKAIENSRMKAEMIAESIGQRIIGTGDIRYEALHDTEEWERGSDELYCIVTNRSNYADKLSKPKLSINKSIDITWITE